jgi:hypothetical protein
MERKFTKSSLAYKCLGFLNDQDCETIVVSTSLNYLLKNGLPIDAFEYCFVDKAIRDSKIQTEFLELMKTSCSKLDFI